MNGSAGDRPGQRLADLWWLLAHDERGHPRVGPDHFALGLAAAVVGELLTQASALVDDGDLRPDPVLAHPLVDLAEAAGQHIIRPARAWIEWLAGEHHRRTERDVVARLAAARLLVRHGRTLRPVDAMTSFTPITILIGAVTSTYPVSDPVRVLAGIALHCGLAPLIATSGEDMRRPLQLLAMDLPRSLLAVVTAIDDAISALALRRR